MSDSVTQDRRSSLRSAVHIALVIIVIVGGYYGYNIGKRAYAIAHPVVNILPLPSSHTGLETPAGQKRLKDSLKADYALLTENYEAQIYRSYCGVASGVMAANALMGAKRFNQEDWFDDMTVDTRSQWDTFFGGMTLEDFANMGRGHGLRVQFFHGGDQSLKMFRTALSAGAQNPMDIIVVNYSRKSLDQKGWGHFSPIGAYHAPTDSVLILDVAAHKYASTWVTTKALWSAMATPDSDSGKNRGYAIMTVTK